MRTVLDERDLDALCRRVASLTPASSPRWGSLTVGGMVGHLIQSARMALGELAVEPRGKRVFRTCPLKHLILYVLPFPRGAPTSRALLVAEPGPLEAEQKELHALLRRLGSGPRSGMGPTHPLFGQLSRQAWGSLMYKHTDHHLRQFGA